MVSPNPLRWSPDLKSLSSLITLVGAIVSSTVGGAWWIGGKIYDFSKSQTVIIQHIKSIEDGVVPRVVKLESDIIETKTNAAAAKQRVDDMAENLKELKSLAQQNLTVSQSHSVDIKATRQAVAPSDAPDGLR